MSNDSDIVGYSLYSSALGDTLRTDDYNSKYVPMHEVSGGIAKNLGSLTVSTVVNYLHERKGTVFYRSECKTVDINPTITWDLNLAFSQFDNKITHGLTVKNITNEEVGNPDYTTRTLSTLPSGNPRALYYSLGIRF